MWESEGLEELQAELLELLRRRPAGPAKGQARQVELSDEDRAHLGYLGS